MKSFFIILWKSAVKFKDDDCITLSAAISFIFLLSLVPFLTLAAKVFGLIKNLFFQNSDINQMDLFLGELNKIIPFVSPEWLKTNILNQAGSSSLTFFSLLMLPIISGMIFHELETAYKKIFNIPNRLMVLKQLFYAFFSILVLLFIFMANFSWVVLESILSNFASSFEKSSFIHDKIILLTRSGFSSLEIVSVIVLCLFFILTSKIFLPSTLNISFKHRLIPSLMFAFLWITARTVFSFYLKHISIVNIVYGSVSSVVIILMWIFYAAITLLFSVEVMHMLHEKSGGMGEKQAL